MLNQTIDFNSAEGIKLMRNLYAFSWGIFRRRFQTDVNSKGKSFKDYVHDAIEKHLRQEDRFDPDKSPIEFHLKFNVILGAISNDFKHHVKTRFVESREKMDSGSNFTRGRLEELEPTLDNVTPDLIDYDRKLIFDTIEKRISGDDQVERIYLAVCHGNFEFSDRSEICEEFDLTLDQFNNAKRRLLTVVRHVIRELKLER